MKLMKTTRYIFLAMMAIVCMTFTACGGDDDGVTSPVDNPDGKKTEWKLYEPFLIMNATPEEVKAYMAEKYPQFIMEEPVGSNSGYALVFNNKQEEVGIVYNIMLNKLVSSSMEYLHYSQQKFDYLWSEMIKRYSAEVIQEGDNGKICVATINGQKYRVTFGIAYNGVVNDNSIAIYFAKM